ncbi:hypothetical protein [Clostridium sp.]
MSNASVEYIRGSAVVKASRQATFSYDEDTDNSAIENISFVAR